MGKGGLSKAKKGKPFQLQNFPCHSTFNSSSTTPNNDPSTAPSLHSRAARRATSPSIDTDKSLKNLRPPTESINHRPAVLAAHHSAGVTKKSKRGRKAVMSSKARRRHEKDLDRAEAIMDRTAKKIQKSKGQARAIQVRRKTWDEINSEIPVQTRTAVSRRQDGEDDDDDDEVGSYVDTDEEMEADGAEGELAPQAQLVVPASAPARIDADDDDEIL